MWRTSGNVLPVLDRHPERMTAPPSRRCQRGRSLSGCSAGRGKDGKPVTDTLRQENYVEDRFDIAIPTQEKLAKALADSGKAPVKLPPDVARQWVRQAHMSVLDVRPIDGPPAE